MAEVWAGHHLDDPVQSRLAIKILRDSFSDEPALRTMFFDEVQIAKRLRHPNIVRVDEVFEDGPTLFLTMELVEGQDLRRILLNASRSDAKMPIPLALLVAREIARGLGYAHLAVDDDDRPLDIVHRDVSPHNVMISKDGVVRLLDFGVARARARSTKTATGIIKGKLSYMSPEQVMAQTLSARTDIFALGIVLWEMLAMRRLFAMDSDAEVMRAVCEASVPPIETIRADVPMAVRELLRSMLAAKPIHRPDSMRDVEDALCQSLAIAFELDVFSQEALATWVAPHLKPTHRQTRALDPRDALRAPPGRADSRTKNESAFDDATRDANVGTQDILDDDVVGSETGL